MILTGFYVRPKQNKGIPKLRKASVKSLAQFCAASFMALGTSVSPVLAGEAGTAAIGKAALSTFGPGGPGMMIIQLMLIAVVGWLAGYIAQAAGKGQIAGMIHVATVFSCIAIVAGVALNAINAVASFLG